MAQVYQFEFSSQAKNPEFESPAKIHLLHSQPFWYILVLRKTVEFPGVRAEERYNKTKGGRYV